MNDLFAEVFEERAGIMEHEASLPKETAERMARADTLTHLHACEVRSVVRMYQDKGGEAVKEFLDLVKKARGAEAMERLRNDALIALGMAK